MRLLAALLLAWATVAGAFNCKDGDGNNLTDGTIANSFGSAYQLFVPRCIAGAVSYGLAPPFTGGGTISSSGTNVTGTGTNFVNDLNVGDTIIANGQTRDVTSISDATHLTITSAITPNLSGASWTFLPPVLRIDDATGGTIIELSGSGRYGTGGLPLTYYDYNERVPPSQSSGNGISAPQIMDIIGDPGGDTTDASGKVGGKGAVGNVGSGTGGGAPAGSTPGTGGLFQVIGGGGGRIISGTGGTGGVGGGVSIAGGLGGNAGASNTCGRGGYVWAHAGGAGSGGCTGGSAGLTILGQAALAFPDTANTTTNKAIVQTSQSGFCTSSLSATPISCTVATEVADCGSTDPCAVPLGWSAVAFPAADGSAHKPLETNGSGQLQFSADAMPAADGTSGQYVTTNGSAQLGFTTLPSIPALKELDDTSDQGINSVTEIQVVSGSVTVTSGKRLIIGVSAKLLDSASANRTFTSQVRYDGTACSDATAVADGDGYDSSVASNDRAMMSYFTTLASPSTGAHTFRLCIKSSSATGTQTKEYAQLSFWEF